MRRQDAIGLAVIVATGVILQGFRMVYVEPVAWGAACLAAPHAWPCPVRDFLFWTQYWSVWGIAALACAGIAFLGGPFAILVAAMTLGVAGLINYNVTWGMLAVAIAGWTWLRRGQNVSG